MAHARELIEDALRRGCHALDELTGKRVLAHYGIRVPRSVRVGPSDRVDAAIEGLCAPFVLKIISAEVLHKSDAGGVRLGLRDAAELRVAMAEITAGMTQASHRLDGFLIEETAPRGHEIVVGGFRDPTFGQVVMLGIGGVFVELLDDVAFRICPITRQDAREMIADLRSAPILQGARGGRAIPEAIVLDVLLAIGGDNGVLVELADCLDELDVNPMIVSAEGAFAVDARFILAREASDAI